MEIIFMTFMEKLRCMSEEYESAPETKTLVEGKTCCRPPMRQKMVLRKMTSPVLQMPDRSEYFLQDIFLRIRYLICQNPKNGKIWRGNAPADGPGPTVTSHEKEKTARVWVFKKMVRNRNRGALGGDRFF